MSVVNISISGGRTSAYMAWWMNENRQAVADHIGCDEAEMKYYFTFANTGMEHDDTLRFMNDVGQKLLGGQVVWLESEAQHGSRKSSKHRVVSYETAFRNADWRDVRHPFHDNILKYGISNMTWQPCTREMKYNAMTSWRETVGGLRPKDYYTAIGIRDDEQRRVKRNPATGPIIYPLVDLNPVDKQDVLDWFKQFEWDLAIPEWQGNCITCHKKSFKKLNKFYNETPEAFEFFDAMERSHGFIGPEFKKGVTEPRVFFRGNRSTKDMIALFDATDADPADYIDTMNDAGCSESCEMYETEVVNEQ
jgi:hypothetical protein